MSSRILRPGQQEQTGSAVAWRAAEGGVPPQRRVTAAGTQAETPAAPDLEQQMEQRLETIRKQARVEGEAVGAQRAAQRLEPVVASWQALVKELSGQRQKVRAEAEEDTVKLAVAIARRILHRELAADPEALLGLVKAAFSRLNARETRRLRVSPGDAQLIEEQRAQLGLPPGVELVRDAALPASSVIFETARGELDASIDTQMGEIQRGLTDVLRRRGK
jgi:flagellar assembly protein FliH